MQIRHRNKNRYSTREELLAMNGVSSTYISRYSPPPMSSSSLVFASHERLSHAHCLTDFDVYQWERKYLHPDNYPSQQVITLESTINLELVPRACLHRTGALIEISSSSVDVSLYFHDPSPSNSSVSEKPVLQRCPENECNSQHYACRVEPR